MEKIEHFLEEDEEILWKYINIKNLYLEFLAIFICEALFAFVIYFLMFIALENTLIRIIVLLLFILIFLWVIYKNPYAKRNFIEKYQLNQEEYKKYQEIYIITTKRWIQKNYRFIKENISQDYYLKKFIEIPSCIIHQKGDILSATLDSFQIIKIWKSKKIEFFISYDFYFLKSTNFMVKISSKQEFQKLIKIIKDIFKIEKEEFRKEGEILYLQN